MTIHVSLELPLCIGMEMGDLNNEFKKCSISSQRKLEELAHQFFRCLYEWSSNCERLGSSQHLPVQRHRPCGAWRACREKCWQTIQEFSINYYVTIVFIAVSSNSMLFLKPIVAHIVINLIIKLETCRGIWQLARNKLGLFSRGTCISSVKHSLTNLTRLISLIQRQPRTLKKQGIFWFGINLCGAEDFKKTGTTTQIGKHIPISVLISSNLIRELVFLWYPNPCCLD